MSEAQPPPPLPQTGLLMKRGKLLWRALLISNFELGAYIFSRPKKKDGTEIHARKGRKLQKEKTTVEVPEPPTTTTSFQFANYLCAYGAAILNASFLNADRLKFQHN